MASSVPKEDVQETADEIKGEPRASSSFEEALVALAKHVGSVIEPRAWQTGYLQNYALIIILGVFLFVSAYLFF